MRFTGARADFERALAALSPALSRGAVLLDILNTVKVEAAPEGKVFLSATNLDLSIRLTVEAEVETPGAAALPARKLTEWVRSLEGDTLVVETVAPQRVRVSSGEPAAHLNGVDADEFPAIKTDTFAAEQTLPGATISDMIRHVSYAVCDREDRPVLQGALWEFRKNAMRMVATDGHRLSMLTVPLDGAAALPQDVILPQKTLEALQKLVRPEADVGVSLSGNHIRFRMEGVEVISRLIEGPYPNYDQVIPKDNDKTLVVRRDELMHTIGRMDIIADNRTHRVRFSLNGVVEFTSASEDMGDAKEKLASAQYEGAPLEIAFNARYLLEGLRRMPSDSVQLTFKASERAALLTPVLAEGEAPLDLTTLVMPLRLDA